MLDQDVLMENSPSLIAIPVMISRSNSYYYLI